MADPKKVGAGLMGALSRLNALALSKRDENLAKFLEPSALRMRMYHGTGATEGGKGSEAIRRIKPSKEGALGSGAYLTPDPKYPSGYADVGDANVLPVYAQVKNPLKIEGTHGDPMIEALVKLGVDEEKAARIVEKAYEDKGYIGKQVQNRAQAAGYDGLAQYKDGELSEVVVYNPNTIKSATGNEGTYDIYNPELSKADGGKVVKGLTGALSKLNDIAVAKRATPEVNRIDMNFKDVTKRVPELTEAANMLARGEITAAQYDSLVNRVKPVAPYSFVPAPATAQDAMRALTENKKPAYGKSKEMTAGEQADLRLDIPAYKDHGVWVNSIHRKDQPTVYDSTSSVKNATMIGSPEKALKVAQGGPKAPFAVIRGDWNPMSQEDAVKNAQAYLDHPDWRQIGYDPERHGYFYDRVTMEPVHGAEEVIQIGPLVLAKKPTYGKKSDEKYAQGGVLHMAKAGAVGNAVEGITGALTKLNEIAKAKKAKSNMADILESNTPPMTTPQGTGLPLMPREQGMYTAREQKDLPRMPMVDKARAAGKSPKYNERMQDLLDSPKARKKVDNLMNKGKELNIQEWYGTEPLRQVAMDMGRTPEQFNSMMAQLASASQRNPVDKQNQIGSYLYHLAETGQLPENAMLLTNKLKEALKADPSLAEGRTLIELPKGYGSLAQGDIFDRAVQIGQGDIGGALPPNKKLGTFYENLLGNLRPVTVDVNALRGPVIEQGDPRWLTSKLVEKNDKGKIINSYKPREMYDTGKMTMREAQQRPGFWEAAPKGSEYAGFEDLWQRGAKRHGVEPAEAQALGWYGSADVTALKTKPENYVDNLERLIRETAQQTGKSPKEVMSDMITGKGFLRKEGGSIEKPDWHHAVEHHMKAGGYVVTEDKHLAKGGDGKEEERASLKELYEALPDLYDQVVKPEVESYKKPRATTDIINRGIIANNPLSAGIDLFNFGLSGIDALTKGTRFPTQLSSEKPFGGSEQVKDLMERFGMTTDEKRPIIETALGFTSPGGLAATATKGAKAVQKLPEVARKAESGLNAMTSNVARPFTPATITVEAVAPDLAKGRPREFQEMVTERLMGDKGPMSMSTVAGKKTTKRPAQGVYGNDAGELETNVMLGIDVPRVGSFADNPLFLSDIASAGKALNQESMAAHRFVPMMTNNIKDASAMLIKPKGGKLTNEEVIELGKRLGGDMVVAHNPRLGGVVVYPFGAVTKGQIPSEFLDAQSVAGNVLGKRADIKFGNADMNKDRLYMSRSEYDSSGAREPSAEFLAERKRLLKQEDRAFPKSRQSKSALDQMREAETSKTR